jgi:PmbA protein
MSADKHLLKLTNIVKNTLLIAKQHQVQCIVAANINIGLGVNVRMQQLDTIEYNQNSEISITIYKNHHQGTVTTTSLEADHLNQAIEKAISIATFTENDPYCGLADPNLIAKNIIDLDLYHPQNITPEIAINIAKNCEQIGLNYAPCIKNSEGSMFNHNSSFIAIGNSCDFIAAYPTTSYSLACNLIAEEKGSMQRDGDYTIARNFQAFFQTFCYQTLILETNFLKLNVFSRLYSGYYNFVDGLPSQVQQPNSFLFLYCFRNSNSVINLLLNELFI